MAWPTLADTKIDFRSPLDEDIFVTLRDRRDKLRVQPWGLDFAEVQVQNQNYTAALSINIFIPRWAKKADIWFWGKRTAGGASSTTFWRWKIGSLTSTEVSQFDATSWAERQCQFTDLSTVQDTEQTFVLEIKDTLPHFAQGRGYGKRGWASDQDKWGWPCRFFV